MGYQNRFDEFIKSKIHHVLGFSQLKLIILTDT